MKQSQLKRKKWLKRMKKRNLRRIRNLKMKSMQMKNPKLLLTRKKIIKENHQSSKMQVLLKRKVQLRRKIKFLEKKTLQMRRKMMLRLMKMASLKRIKKSNQSKRKWQKVPEELIQKQLQVFLFFYYNKVLWMWFSVAIQHLRWDYILHLLKKPSQLL